ncbi:MAG: hypothetical protein AB7E72_12790 [Lysobacterales bacterium]
MKICATTLGETAGDLLSMTLNVGYAASSVILIALFLISLSAQMAVRRFHPLLFWLVILSTSTAGTTLSDYLDRSLGLGYAWGSVLLASGLLMVLLLWRSTEKSLSVSRINSPNAELFYWVAVLVSNTLGTALGDYLADDSGLGFFGGAALIGSGIAVVALLAHYRRVNTITLFWIAFVLTRPFGATFGDLLTKPTSLGGIGFGTVGSSAVLATLLLGMVLHAHHRHQPGRGPVRSRA